MHDLLFCGARLIDGSGSPARLADVAVDAGLISAICDVADTGQRRAARHVVECGGLVLAPGFIDAHTHDDALMLENAPFDQAHPKLSQGVTTVVIGNCGISLAPLDAAVHRDLPPPLNILKREAFRFSSVAAYLDALADRPPVCNVVTLLGHTSLRVKHLPDLQQEATAEQAAVMAAEVGAALQQGAWGLSTGVFYTPARAATKDELIAVARPLGPAGALLTMHIRDDAAQIDAALQEAFEVARGADAALVISHHKLSGRANHGRSAKTLAMIEAAGLRQDVCVDCYPYDASSTMLIPDRVHLSREVLITWSSTEPAAAGRSLFSDGEGARVDASGTGRATRASGRGELLNGRGRRAENHAAPPDDDRLRRPAAPTHTPTPACGAVFRVSSDAMRATRACSPSKPRCAR